MPAIKSICVGVFTVLALTWCIWEICWPFLILDLPQWVNWLSGGSFAVYLSILFGCMHYDSARKGSKKDWP